MTQAFNAWAAALGQAGQVAGNEIVVVEKGGVSVRSSPERLRGSTAAALMARRQANIANYLKGALIPATAWAATHAYVFNDVASVANGQTIICSASGTSAGTIPVYSGTVLTGRPLVDSGATWYGLPLIVTATDPQAPTLTFGANAAALGLTLTQFVTVSNGPVDARVRGTGAFLQSSATATKAYGFAIGDSSASGNSTGQATAAGYTASNVYQTYSYDIEFYVTDSYFGICIANNAMAINIEVDGVLVTPNGAVSSGTYGYCFGYDYHGVVRRRLVRIKCNSTYVPMAGVALSAIGYIEASDAPVDNLLILGDSINHTLLAGSTTNPLMQDFASYLKRFLGFNAVYDASVTGTGYVLQPTHYYNVGAMLANAANQTMFALVNPGHILFEAGCNDVGTTLATVQAAALAAWQAARALFPLAKISVMDGFPNATGPSVNALAQAAGLLTTFNTWADPNSRFIPVTTALAATAITQGTNNAGNALQLGNTCDMISTDGTHPTPVGAWYYGYRVAQLFFAAWGEAY